MSNWALIEEKYGVIDPNLVSGEVIIVRNLLVNDIIYGNFFRVVENNNGIFVCAKFPCSIVHKDIFIPFDDISFINKKKWRMELISLNMTDDCILGVPAKLSQRIRLRQSQRTEILR